MTATDWVEFFDDLDPNAALHRNQATHYVNRLQAWVGLNASDRVLDHGCGFGAITELVARSVSQVWAWDPSPNMRAATMRKAAGTANVLVTDLPPWESSPGNVPSFDLILANSVVQYMSDEDFGHTLTVWREMLSPNGRLVLSDLIPDDHSTVQDTIDLVRFGRHTGAALKAASEALGGVRRYWSTRKQLSLLTIEEQHLAHHCRHLGFNVTFLPENLTHFRARKTVVIAFNSHGRVGNSDGANAGQQTVDPAHLGAKRR